IRRYRLPAVILRAPNIYGPCSQFTVKLLGRLQAQTLPIVDGGRNPCNLVYVDNLVQAIVLALTKPKANHETFFITDRETISWEQYLEDHAELAGKGIPRVNSAELVPPPRKRWLLDSLRAIPKVLVSGELRAVLRQIPLVQTAETFLWNRFDALPAK